MPTACINQPDARIHLHGERLEIRARNPENSEEQTLREIPIRDLDRLVFMEGVSITSQALAALLRAGIPVSLIGWNGKYLGGFLPATNAHGAARLSQYERTRDDSFVRVLAGKVLHAKLYNQRRVLQRLLASRRSEPTLEGAIPEISIVSEPDSSQKAITWLDGFFASMEQADTLDELRGYEGAATARYFQTWASFLPDEFPFERRSTRLPLNAVNACVSFAATVLYSECVAFLHSHGLDPSLGLLHRTEDGRWSLALDLIEPFRPCIGEALTLDLFSHRILNKDHFESRDGGVFLNEEGRKKFFLQYERRMERQFLSECVEHRTTLRQQLEHQAVQFKTALSEMDRFQPFLMN